MNCQVCDGNITLEEIDNITIYKCDNCGGFYIKKGDLNNLIKHRGGDIEFSSMDNHFHKDDHSTLKCPFCKDSAMVKNNFIEYSDIILDHCETCGAYWIDNGELEKMQKYIDEIEKETKPTFTQILISLIYKLPQV